MDPHWPLLVLKEIRLWLNDLNDRDPFFIITRSGCSTRNRERRDGCERMKGGRRADEMEQEVQEKIMREM